MGQTVAPLALKQQEDRERSIRLLVAFGRCFPSS